MRLHPASWPDTCMLDSERRGAARLCANTTSTAEQSGRFLGFLELFGLSGLGFIQGFRVRVGRMQGSIQGAGAHRRW